MSAPPTAGQALPEHYTLPASSPHAERVLILAFAVVVGFTTLEAPLRYFSAQVGAAWLIYGRDVAVVLAMASLAMAQLRQKQLQLAFVIFLLFVLYHGVVSALLCNVPIALLMGMKNLIYPMFGVIFLPTLLKRKRSVAALLVLVWLVTAVGILLDHAGYPMPWKGANTTVGDFSVVINRKWNFQGEDRVGGFARDSVSAGALIALAGMYCLLFSRSLLWRALTAGATLFLIYLTTSKGGAVAFAFAILACLLPGRKSELPNKALLTVVFLVMMLSPILLPGSSMPRSPSFLVSFIDRVQRVWPSAWHNIAEHSWVFGSGMGNIGVGQQYLGLEGSDSGDNLFVLAYGYFGALAVVYLTLPYLAAVGRKSPVGVPGRYAILTLIYVFAYGIVANVIESPVVAFMLGSAFQALALRRKDTTREASRSLSLRPVTDTAG